MPEVLHHGGGGLQRPRGWKQWFFDLVEVLDADPVEQQERRLQRIEAAVASLQQTSIEKDE